MDRPVKELRHDRHTVSLLTDHLVSSPTQYKIEGTNVFLMKENLSNEKNMTS